MSYTCRPSNRDGSVGLVIAPNGGRAIGSIFAYGSSWCRALSAGTESPSLHTARRPLLVTEVPRGKSCCWNASPPGWSMRSIQVEPCPPGRVDVKRRYFPSGDQRGLLLSVLGDVKRTAEPPLVGTTHTSRW